MNCLKMFSALILVSLWLTPALALAGDDRNLGGGFQDAAAQGGASASLTTVAEALKLRDDAWVTLIGKISQRLGHEKFLFADGTGTVKVEIDDEVWRGLTVGPNDLVEIQGEVDKGLTKTEIDVKSIVKK